MLHIDNVELSNLDIRSFIPGVIAKHHEFMFINFYKRGYSTFINKAQHLCSVDSNNMLFPSKLYVKIFFEEEKLSFITYIEKLRDHSLVLLDERGNLDSFGSKFSSTCGLNYDFPRNNKAVNIFLMMPQLIPIFLPYFYNLSSFKIDVSL